MNSVFESQVLDMSYHWTTISDIDCATLEKWKQNTRDIGLNVYSTRMPFRMKLDKMVEVLKEHINMMDIVQMKIEKLLECMIKPYIFILTDIDGVVLSVHAKDELADILNRKQNIGVGTSFAMEYAGVNAISTAMERKESVFVLGSEHDLKMFSEWSCLCSPIRVGKEIIGYLDMSFATNEDAILAGSMFEHLLRGICGNLEELCPAVRREQIYNTFDDFKLSPREKEIGYCWLMNHSTLRISEELGIAEGTVRNVLKKVYSKTGVNDKGQFFRRFL
jgi:transcriptional regulator of acetoin/glycerol metabolism/DNA-binding CsgD family transcriptional regulator